MTSSEKAPAKPLTTAGRPGAFMLPGAAAPAALLGGHCRSCGAYDFPRGRFCPRCSAAAMEEVPLSTRGNIHTWSTVYQDPGPSFVGAKPFTIVTVELPEGVRVVSTLSVAMPPEELRVGLPLVLDVVSVGSDADGNDCYDFRFRPA
ncbi:MAG: OB-fold domain-containing protein [Dehalococcoidia bacterium]|nr:OB-fold domain-containing protein [Dehalococcoidia bacterium]